MGLGELVLILLLVLLFFGAGKLPAIGAGLGKAAKGVKDAVKGGGPSASPPSGSSAVRKDLPGKDGGA